MMFDNTAELRCQGECGGEIPWYIEVNSDDETICADCGHVIDTADGEPPERDIPEFAKTNAYDITREQR